jgi:cation diffusion facilitator CzcD-associated flavoprotein CzcO
MTTATAAPKRVTGHNEARVRPRTKAQRRRYDVVVVGAGPAGLSAALALKDNGLRPLVLDRADNVGASWRARYDRLRLNSARRFSHLPGRPFPPGTPMFPTRDQLIAHLERHSREPGMELLFGANVTRIERGDGCWLALLDGGVVRAPQLIVATGYDHSPHIPDWSGRNRFEGRLLHSSAYRNPEPFRGLRVLVAGPGSSGMEIAHDLAEGGAAQVWLAARTAPNIFLREGPGGLPGDVIAAGLLRFPLRFADAAARFGRKRDVGDLAEYGLPIPEEGVFARLRRLGVAPAIVDKDVIEAIRERRFQVVPGVDSLDADGARLADGNRIEPDAVIAATGYRRGLEPLVGHLGVLAEGGLPRALGERPAADGLRFVGYVPRPGMIGYAAKEARRASRAISEELGR